MRRPKELIAVALLAAIRGSTTRQHIKRALALGASKREVVEALELSMHITGAPSLHYGLSEDAGVGMPGWRPRRSGAQTEER